LFFNSKLILAGSKLAVSGWGLINGDVIPKYLYRVTLPVIARPVCTKAWHQYHPKMTVKFQHICAGTTDKTICPVILFLQRYSQTCVQRPTMGLQKSGCCPKVVAIQRLIKFSSTNLSLT
jgi:hypothetical protein